MTAGRRGSIGPHSLLWNFSGANVSDPERDRIVEVRIDSPLEKIDKAIDLMRASGWELADTPDAHDDPHQRLFFRRTQNILDEAKAEMFDHALSAAQACDGRLHSWMIEEEISK